MKNNNYQARLNKVLSKMKTNGINEKFIYLKPTGITIEYNDGKFILEDNDLCSIEISLNTVESLLKDLGVIE